MSLGLHLESNLEPFEISLPTPLNLKGQSNKLDMSWWGQHPPKIEGRKLLGSCYILKRNSNHSAIYIPPITLRRDRTYHTSTSFKDTINYRRHLKEKTHSSSLHLSYPQVKCYWGEIMDAKFQREITTKEKLTSGLHLNIFTYTLFSLQLCCFHWWTSWCTIILLWGKYLEI